MKAVKTRDDLPLVDVSPLPPPVAGQVLIRVAAAGVNNADILQRKGLYPVPAGASDVLGLEVSGTIMAVGAGVPRERIGQTVCALLDGGGYADMALADAALCFPVEGRLDLTHAAGLPEAMMTVMLNVFELGGLTAGQTLLIHGGSSGVGTLALQMAKHAGARVITTSRSADKAAFCKTLGADVALDVTTQDVAALGEQADVILDMVGAAYVEKNLAVIAHGGRIVSIAFPTGNEATVRLSALMAKQARLTGSFLRTAPREQKRQLADRVRRDVWPAVTAGAIRPVIDRIFALGEARAAHDYFEQGQHKGKVVLTP